MSELEDHLARLPLRAAPAAWRAEILRTAREAGPAETSIWKWWRAPQPLALAATWLLIALLRFATPAEIHATAPTPLDAAQWKARVRTQEMLVTETSEPPTSPSRKVPPPHGARLARRERPLA